MPSGAAAPKQFAALLQAGAAIRLAEASCRRRRRPFATAAARLGYARITAPVAGTLIHRDVERGDVVQAGKVLMVLSPAGETQLIVQIDERNLNLLALGQPAVASADAYPQQRFAHGWSTSIRPSTRSGSSVEVKLQVPSPPDYLKQDMTVSVDIEAARHPGAVIVRSTPCTTPTGPRRGCCASTTGGRVARTSASACAAAVWAEVLAGLEPGAGSCRRARRASATARGCARVPSRH